MFKDFLLILVVTSAINSGMGIIIPILPNMMMDYGFSTIGLSLPFVALVLGRIIIKPYTGKLLTRMTGRMLLTISSSLYVLIFLLYPQVESKEWFIALRFLEGLVEGIVGVVVTDMAISHTRGKQNSGFLMGLFSSSFGLGFLLGPLVGSLTYNAYGIDTMFYAGAMIGGLSLLASLMMNPSEKSCSANTTRGVLITSWRAKRFLGIYMPSILRRCLLFSFMIIIPLFSVDRLGLSKEDIGFLFVVSAIITTSLMPFTGKLADRINPRAITIAGLFCMGASLMAISVTASVSSFLIFYIVETLAFAFMLPAATKVFAMEIADNSDRPIIVGAFTGLVEIITLLLAVALPSLYSLNAGVPWLFLGMACILSIAPFVKPIKRSPEELRLSA
jgi:MFS family permease